MVVPYPIPTDEDKLAKIGYQPPSSLLTDMTLYHIGKFFEETTNHKPSDEMWEALSDLASTMERIVRGEMEPKLYLSSLDPGVGKTVAITRFVSSLLAWDFYKGCRCGHLCQPTFGS